MYKQGVFNSELVKYDNFLGGNLNSPIFNFQRSELLCIILDLTPSWWLKFSDQTLSTFIDTIISFSSMYLTFSTEKELAIIGVVPEKSEYIYTTDMKADMKSSICSTKNGYLQFFETKIRENIYKLINGSNSLVNCVNLSGGFIKSLCYFKRMFKINNSLNNSQLEFSGRFIVVRTGLPDSSSCFMSMMNGVFTAQKHDICIDVCILNPDDSSINNSQPTEFDKTNILRQSVDMTNGIYLTINKIRDLLQYFITLYLTDVFDRKCMTMINNSSVDIDFRASCFCHGTLVSVGYVCSLCLAVYCQFSSICDCCDAVFHDKKLRINGEC